jgi:predicted nucleic-acid-binding protein
MTRRIRLDANVILRFLRNDDSKLSPVAASLFKNASSGKVALFVSAVTINEVFFVFSSFYKLSQPDTARILLPFVRTGVVDFEDVDCLIDALQRVIAEDVDFGDAYLAAQAAKSGDLVASFDKDMKQFKDIVLFDFESKS